MCTEIARLMPTALQIPARLPLLRLFLRTNTKSAPGLMTMSMPNKARLKSS